MDGDNPSRFLCPRFLLNSKNYQRTIWLWQNCRLKF